MLETVGQFGLQYSEQAQGTLGSLVATPSLLSRVIESQWQDAGYSQVQVMRARPSTRMVVFGIEDGCGSPFDRLERGDSQGVSLLSICRASRWQEDVPGSSSSVLLERDEETHNRLCATMSHVSAGKG